MTIEFNSNEESFSTSIHTVLLDESSDPIFAFAKDGTYLYINNAFAKPMGKIPKDVIGKKIWDIFPGEEGDRRFRAVKEAFDTGLLKDIEVKVPGDIYFLTTVKPVKNSAGEVLFVICISKNITEIKRIREELQKEKEAAEQANKAKGEFISNMSHEVRTPLNAIIGYSELIKTKNQDPKIEEYIKGIITGGKNLLTIINDILDLSKSEAGMLDINYEPTNIFSILNEINQIFSYQIKNKELQLIFNVSEDTPKYLMLDETRMRQVLLNIVGNAIKFTHHGYVAITITVLTRKVDSLNLCITIEDTGVGIPEGETNRVFEAFHQQTGQSIKKYGGTGLGLTISKKFVELMNGSISVSSMLGKGTKFIIVLKDVAIPTIIHGENINTAMENNEMLAFKPSTILYVEDVEANRKVLKGYLEGFNFRVEEASDGLSAFEKAKAIVPDLILLDIHMPILNGIETYKLLRENKITANIPVVALTATALESEIQNIKSIFQDVLEKPIYKDKLITILKKYIPHEKKDEIFVNNGPLLPEYKDFILLEIDKENIRDITKNLENGIVMEEVETLIAAIEKASSNQLSVYLMTLVDVLKEAYKEYNTEQIEKLLVTINNIL